MEILNNIFLDFRDYFVSVYENTLFQLALFTCALWLVFFISHVLKNLRIRKSRRSIPLVIGGWGTRGKSGTERLKAGLFNALGFGVVSKTSGCEAMFLHSHPYSQLREMFLFRPYDKATIWEQADVLNIAGKLETDVMLWECMGLTPTYIEVLQRSWTQDDLSTITNTYPDHEDVQGPAGINVTEVMGSFIPRNSRLITTEEVMFPRLEDFSRDLNSSVEQVNWLDVGLLTSDLMERFPYSAHPNNVALVLAIADEFQIPRDYAVKEMSDRVVPDLGVLKTFPAADLRGRKLIFTLGNSANEKFGCLGNWTRLGFDKISVEKDPDVFVTTVVNNRADRIPRSRVFAGIITGDISADRHFLVGNNLKGFMSMIEDELEHNLSQVSLWGRDNKGSKEEAVEELVKKADWLRLPVTDNTITSRLGAMLKVSLTDRNQLDLICSLWDSPEKLEEKLKELKSDNVDDICYWVKHYLEARKGFVEIKERILNSTETEYRKIDQEFREWSRKIFLSKLIVIEDYYASGDEVVNEVAKNTPPGFTNWIMGLQNIKGTGLDFCYKWPAWEKCFLACRDIDSDDVKDFERGLNVLTSFQEYGVLCEDILKRTLESALDRPVAQKELYLAQLKMIKDSMEQSLKKIKDGMNEGGSKTSVIENVVDWVEKFIDSSDAVKRRKKANIIYQDLIDFRISHERAAFELQELNKRQKGGWLKKKLLGSKK